MKIGEVGKIKHASVEGGHFIFVVAFNVNI